MECVLKLESRYFYGKEHLLPRNPLALHLAALMRKKNLTRRDLPSLTVLGFKIEWVFADEEPTEANDPSQSDREATTKENPNNKDQWNQVEDNPLPDIFD